MTGNNLLPSDIRLRWRDFHMIFLYQEMHPAVNLDLILFTCRRSKLKLPDRSLSMSTR